MQQLPLIRMGCCAEQEVDDSRGDDGDGFWHISKRPSDSGRRITAAKASWASCSMWVAASEKSACEAQLPERSSRSASACRCLPASLQHMPISHASTTSVWRCCAAQQDSSWAIRPTLSQLVTLGSMLHVWPL